MSGQLKARMIAAPASQVLYTIGTGDKPRDDLIKTLKSHGIGTLVDVRSKPYSRTPDYNRESMQGCLKKEGIAYEYLGDSLGGFAEGGFEKHRGSEPYSRGLDALERIASKRRSAILCAETDPTKCHRLGVGEDMEKRGWRVRHILGIGPALETDALPQ